MFSSECHQLTQGLYRTKEHWALCWESQPRCWHYWYALSQHSVPKIGWQGECKLQSLQIQDAQSLVPLWWM